MGIVHVKIWGNWAEVNAGGYEVGMNGRPSPRTAFPAATPDHATTTTDGGVWFTFPAGALNTDKMLSWNQGIVYGSESSARRKVKAAQVAATKNNALSIATGGPFAVAARALREGGAKDVLGVDAPFVLFKWSAKDLAKYCTAIYQASVNGATTIGWTEIETD